jgi:hypothetical protein
MIDERSMARVAVAAGVVVAVAGGRLHGAPPGDLAGILAALAERTQQYYDRFISIICTETVHQQDLRFNLSPMGRPRVSVYELSVSRDPNAKTGMDFRVERVLQTVNGRPVRKNQEPGCTDPKTGSPEPLGFLLSENQARYRFSLPDVVAGGPQGTQAVDFIETPPERVQITWKDNCFNAEGGGHQGRLWFERDTIDVRQVDVRLAKPFLVPMPAGQFGLNPAIRVERWESTLRFSRVHFTQPDETALLPESLDTLSVFRGASSLRMTQRLTNFRRFLSETTIKGAVY